MLSFLKDKIGYKSVTAYDKSKLDNFNPRDPVNLEICGLWNQHHSLATVQKKLLESSFKIEVPHLIIFTVVHCIQDPGASAPDTYRLNSQANPARLEFLLSKDNGQLSTHIRAKAKVIRAYD